MTGLHVLLGRGWKQRLPLHVQKAIMTGGERGPTGFFHNKR